MPTPPIVAITHKPDELATYYHDRDLARLRAVAEVRVLGSNRFADIRERLGDVDIITGSWGMPALDHGLLAAAPRLKAVCYAAGTVKNFAKPEAFARGVIITTAMHANAVPVAEATVAIITLAGKNLFACYDRIRARGAAGWQDKAERAYTGNYAIAVGVIGFGAIGQLVVGKLRDMDVEVLVHDPYADPAKVRAAGAEPVTLLDLARRCQVSSLHAPNIPACEGMISAPFFTAMPDGALFVNTARGKLVDEAALIAELRTGRISAHLDVTWPEPPVAESPLWTLPNCWLSPHRLGSSGREIQRMGRYATDEVLAIIAGREPRYRVLESMLATMA